MNSKQKLILWIAAISAMSGTATAQTQVPNEFQAGQPARAAEVNANFDTLEAAIDQNISDIDQNNADIEQNAADIQAIQGTAGLSPEAAQIQSGLDLTSGLRWLIAEYYGETGVFPVHNASAGAPSANEFSNRFVESASVNSGVIEILFGANAAAQLAGQTVNLQPIDPGSGAVWFDCSGDGMTDAFVAELDCVFNDRPLQPMYTIRQMVLTAFDLLEQSDAQQLITDYYNQNGSFPSDNLQAGLEIPSQYQNKYISELTISGAGQISMTFGNDALAVIQGSTMRWTPDDALAVIRWECDSLDIFNMFLPIECRQ